MTDYFETAKKIIRKHEERRKLPPCKCGLYTFPHRRSDRCDDFELEAREAREEMERGLRTKAEWDAEELSLHDRAEARAINSTEAAA